MKKTVLSGHPTMDGAGVKLTRIFSNNTVKITDPFLLLDHFGSDNPKDYIAGFPWHPHRGIETVTYMLHGYVEHGDSIGNKGVIGPGDIQWMSAGSGIIHQEMPKSTGVMYGLQLWVNMPAAKKMSPPKYRGILTKEVPSVKKDGFEIKIISGSYGDKKGPVKDLVIDVVYLDILLEKEKSFVYDVKKGYNTLCYIFEGSGQFSGEKLKKGQAIIIQDADRIEIRSAENLRFILVSGKPLKEPIAWGGPIVMNTQEELATAFEELDEGTFIKKK